MGGAAEEGGRCGVIGANWCKVKDRIRALFRDFCQHGKLIPFSENHTRSLLARCGNSQIQKKSSSNSDIELRNCAANWISPKPS